MAGMKQYWLGSPEGDDRQRSADEVRLIHEMTTQEIEAFLAANPVDTGSANQLRKEQPYIALQVIDRGALKGCRDPSGVLVARMRDARRGTLAPGPSNVALPPMQPVDPNASEVEKFCAVNRIDSNAIHSLKLESEEVQMAVMARGPLTNARNPSGALMSRIRIVKEAGPAALQQVGPGLPSGGQLPAAGTPATLMSILGLADHQAQPPPPPGGGPPGGGPAPMLALGGVLPQGPAGGTQPDAGAGLDMAGEAMRAIQKMSQAPPPPSETGGTLGVLAAAERQLQDQKMEVDKVNPNDI